MMNLLIKKFVPDWENTQSAKVRYAVCRVCSWVGIVLNLLLFASKYAIGVMVNSVSIKADGLNNLTDAGSTMISIISFHFAEKPADKGHPYGHERTETITSLFVGIAIVLVGYEMLKQSIAKIIHPEPIDFSFAAIAVLVLSIAVKFVMYGYNRKYGKKYHSTLLEANALDSRSDVLGTSAVLLSTLISPLIHFNLDGYMGVVVSCIIFYSAYELLRDVINALLGEAPDPALIQKLEDKIMANDLVHSVHDVIIHSYGPNSLYATAHAEVDGRLPMVPTHEQIDLIERQVKNDLDIELTIHTDPMLWDDPQTHKYLTKTEHAIQELNKNWDMHDFHVVNEKDGVHLYFDLIVGYDEKRTEEEIAHEILDRIYSKEPLDITINLDHPYD